MKPILNILKIISFFPLYCHQQLLFSASEEGKNILSQFSTASEMEVNIFMLLIFFMLNIIQEDRRTGPKGFLLDSDVFIYASLTILTIGLNRISAESLLSWV